MRATVSAVSAVSTTRDGVKLGVKVMNVSEVDVWDVVGRYLEVYSVMES